VSFDDDFDDVFKELGMFNSKFRSKFLKDLDKIFGEIQNGKLKGTWETREINEPGVKGYFILGRFGNLDEMPELIEPLKPLKRRPLPDNPFELPKNALKETREPLTDVFEEKEATVVYVELPGEEKDDIKLSFEEGNINIEAKNFSKKIRLADRHVASEEVSTEYKNRVLKITIPKKPELHNQGCRRERMI
jgi:HSP20 family molecular chaperone IbpA